MDTIGDFKYMPPTEYSMEKVPWCLQPEDIPTTSDAERERLQELRRVWLQLIDTRIASYEITPIQQVTPSTPLLAEGRPNCNAGSASNRVFEIAELLEKILRYANSSAHLVALSVCRKWRDVALYIMRPSNVLHDFAHAYPCPPVKFGDRIPEQLNNWLPATTEEFEDLYAELELNLPWDRDGIYRSIDRFQMSNRPNIIETVCFPGRITMASNATSDQVYAPQIFYTEQLEGVDIQVDLHYHRRRIYVPKWVDVTQFRLNPYLANLFQDTLETINSLYEISLPPSCFTDSGTTWNSLPPAAMSYLATQFLTQPPVTSLNVSTWIPMMEKPRVRKALHIINVRNEDGIRVSEILTAMKAASELAVEHWKYWARLLRAAIQEGHPKQDFWVVDGGPKLLISVDPFGSEWSSETWLHHLTCMHALPGWKKRQEEWIPKELWYSEEPK
ncbi:hypothetical protein SLS60_009618 [Paraconiothyrium brasiliense]|uniref:F-box domain-containing protein n=1 Tax=Paraconiothyrium brasiliense TaxID=300254 RepID=A0ABR3QUT9_9PLEO